MPIFAAQNITAHPSMASVLINIIMVPWCTN